MLKRAFAFGLSLAMTNMVYGGATIDLRPVNPGPYPGTNPQTVNVDVYLVQDGGVDTPLRMIQFDLTATATAGQLGFPANPTHCNNIPFWDFSATQVGGGDPSMCGTDHYVDGVRVPSPLPTYGANIFVVAFGSENELGPNSMKQFILPEDGEVKVGTMAIGLPAGNGRFTLDIANASETHVDKGAQVRFGFGSNIDGTTLTTWRTSGANPQLTGGTHTFCVGNPDPPCNVCPALVSSMPACEGVLGRSAGNCVLIQYAGTIASPPTPGTDVQVVEILDGGATGADVTDQFTFEIVGAGDVLKVSNTGTPLANATWYAIRGVNAANCFDFDLQFGVLYGDANGDETVNAFDLNLIWQNRTNPLPECSPLDVTGDGVINAFDLNAAWQNRGPAFPAKPTGHTCDPTP